MTCNIPPSPTKLTLSMLVAESLLPHVTEANGALAATVYEHVAAGRVELCGCDHLCQFLHVGWLDVHDV